MKSDERVFCVLALFGAMAIVLLGLFGASEAFAAGIGWDDSYNSLGGSFSSPTTGVLSTGSSISNFEYNGSGSFWVRLDPSIASFGSAYWNFYPSYYGSDYWRATVDLSGRCDIAQTIPKNENWYQTADLENGSTVSAGLNFYASQYEGLGSVGVGGLELVEATVGGSISINGGQVTGAYFKSWNGYESSYSWPNGWDQPPIITKIPMWYGRGEFYGSYLDSLNGGGIGLGSVTLASTSQSASVPEPSTVAELACFGFLVIALIALKGIRKEQAKQLALETIVDTKE